MKNNLVENGAVPGGSSRFRFRRGNVLFLVIGMGLMALIQLLASNRDSHKNRAVGPVPSARTQAVPLPPVAVQGQALPPWGSLTTMDLPLEQPDELLPRFFDPPVQVKWVFRHQTREQLEAFLQTCALDDAQKKDLLTPQKWEAVASGFVLAPSSRTILSLNKTARQKIYSLLTPDPLNSSYHFPFRFQAPVFEKLFAHCGLPQDKLDLIEHLSFTNQDFICFADAETLRHQLTTNEASCFFSALFSVPTLLMRLHITPDTDVDALVNYWGKGGRERTIRPLLESMTKIPQGVDVNVSFLLPPFARLRLYTFEDRVSRTNTLAADCFWTSMNFFNEQPDARLFEPEYKARLLQTDYTRVAQGQPELGDLVTLISASDLAVHMCVYVADGVVFTKNGADPQQPWVLMKLESMLKMYSWQYPVKVHLYRSKKLQGQFVNR